MEEKEKKKPGCMINFLSILILIWLSVYFINSCESKPSPRRPEPPAQEEKTEKKDQTENPVQVREEKPAPEVIQTAAEQNRVDAMTDEELKKEGRKRTAKTKRECCDLLYELMNFKGKKEFAKYGFGVGGPYNSWMKRTEALRDQTSSDFQNKFISFELASSPGVIMQLGFEYMRMHGIESEYAKTVLPDLKKTIGYESYLKKKNKDAKKKKKAGN